MYLTVNVIYLWYLWAIKIKCGYSSDAYNNLLHFFHDWTTQWNFRFKVKSAQYILTCFRYIIYTIGRKVLYP